MINILNEKEYYSMSIYSIFLDKDEYYNKGMKLGKYTFNNLAEFIKIYLDITPKIDTIYVAGACYGRSSTNIKMLIDTCFGTKKRYNIALIRKYKGFTYKHTKDAINKSIHKYLQVKLDKGKSDHRKMMFFLSKNKVMAVLIGSSNYSPNTYLKKSSSEADILLIDYKNNDSDKINKNIVSSLENVFLDHDQSLNDKQNYSDIKSNIIVSKSLNDNDLLQEIFERVKYNSGNAE